LDIVEHGIPAYNELERFSDSNQLVFGHSLMAIHPLED